MLAVKLAQNEYNAKLLKAVDEEIVALEHYLSHNGIAVPAINPTKF